MNIDKRIINAENDLKEVFAYIENNALENQNKVLEAFRNNRIALRHFAPTTGYGYDDIGRDTLCRLFADVFGTESAIVSPLIANGTHAISTVCSDFCAPATLCIRQPETRMTRLWT